MGKILTPGDAEALLERLTSIRDELEDLEPGTLKRAERYRDLVDVFDDIAGYFDPIDRQVD